MICIGLRDLCSTCDMSHYDLFPTSQTVHQPFLDFGRFFDSYLYSLQKVLVQLDGLKIVIWVRPEVLIFDYVHWIQSIIQWMLLFASVEVKYVCHTTVFPRLFPWDDGDIIIFLHYYFLYVASPEEATLIIIGLPGSSRYFNFKCTWDVMESRAARNDRPMMLLYTFLYGTMKKKTHIVLIPLPSP